MKQILALIAFMVAMSAQAQTVKVAVAADLRYAMDEVVKEFKKNNLDANIELIYGSSGNASTQISNVAPFDLYFSADKMYPLKLKEAGLTLTGLNYMQLGEWFCGVLVWM